jgi:hypothetical protein
VNLDLQEYSKQNQGERISSRCLANAILQVMGLVVALAWLQPHFHPEAQA